MGIELQGIERVPPEAREDARLLGNLTLWLSANTTVPTLALGGLGVSLFGLGWGPCLGAILAFNLGGAGLVASLSTLGPRLGLRQMTISRFSFGWNGAKLMACLNIASCIGWSAVNTVVGAQLLAPQVPVWLGILLLATLATPVSIFGYRYVHRYERYAWIPMALICLVLAGNTLGRWTGTPATGAWGPWLSFGAAVFGYAAGWCPYAADYNVRQPQESRVFGLTFWGVFLPCVALEVLGVGLATVPAFHGLSGGELVAAGLKGLGPLGRAIRVFLALSVVAANIPNDYSLGLCVQVLGRAWQRVPRHWWTLLGAVVYVSLALPAAQHFSETLTDFLLVIGYWLGPWVAVLGVEHFAFRRQGYPVEDWDQPSRLPASWPALVSLGLGLGAAALGASQALWTGPVARWAGGDLGFELGILVSGASYWVLRRFSAPFDGSPGRSDHRVEAPRD